jgi:hypothetical protein
MLENAVIPINSTKSEPEIIDITGNNKKTETAKINLNQSIIVLYKKLAEK